MYTKKPKNQNMIAKTAKVKYMYTRKPKNQNKEPKHDRPKQLRLNTCIQENQRTKT
jgi:hypothetical protein